MVIFEKLEIPIFYSSPYGGPTTDITIFRQSLKGQAGVMGIADGTYQGKDDLLIIINTMCIKL